MELDGVTDVQPVDEDYEYFFKVSCSSCREPHPKVVSLNRIEEHEISGSRGSAHFVWRCQNCKKEHSASFTSPSSSSKSTAPLPYTSDTAQLTPFIALDCRGLEFTDLHFRGKWKCKGLESGTSFEFELDDEGRWDDYDEKAGAPVGVAECKAKMQRA